MTAIKYLLFAVVSTFVNLSSQALFLMLYNDFGAIYGALIAGTGMGLIVKYELDKRWIFYHIPENSAQNTKKFGLYSLMGLFTTAIFWGMELGFNAFFSDPNAKYMGGFLGLSIGYIIKYFLDKKYVFTVA